MDLFGDTNTEIMDGLFAVPQRASHIVGSTSRGTTYNSRQRQAIAQMGATGILDAHNPSDTLGLRLRGGYASGDANPDDGTSSDFFFDRDFSAGIVLFDQLNGGIEAATHHLLSDPDLSGQPPDGAEILVTEGSFKATFVQPGVELKPIPWVALRLGTTLAWSTAPPSLSFVLQLSRGWRAT